MLHIVHSMRVTSVTHVQPPNNLTLLPHLVRSQLEQKQESRLRVSHNSRLTAACGRCMDLQALRSMHEMHEINMQLVRRSPSAALWRTAKISVI